MSVTFHSSSEIDFVNNSRGRERPYAGIRFGVLAKGATGGGSRRDGKEDERA